MQRHLPSEGGGEWWEIGLSKVPLPGAWGHEFVFSGLTSISNNLRPGLPPSKKKYRQSKNLLLEEGNAPEGGS